jgi:UPF0716 protein FxsA
MAGGFLITPGILTDSVGFALLIPPVRHFIARWGAKKVFQSGSVNIRTFGMGSGSAGEADHERTQSARHRRDPTDGPIIEGDFERMDDRSSRNKDN